MIFPSDHESPEVMEPGEEAFYFPASFVSSKWSSILGFRPLAPGPMRRDHINAQHRQFIVQRIAVISLVPNDSFGKLDQESAFDGLSDQLHFMRRSAGHVEGVRKTRAVCNGHDLGPLAPFSFPNAKAPLFAGEKDPSMKASRTSRPPRSRRSSARVRRISSNTPSFDHFWCQRWHVWYGGYRSGRSFHGAPVRRIQRMPLRTSRGSRRGRPRESDRLDSDGIKGSNRVHCTSVKSIWSYKTRFSKMFRLF